MLYVSAASWQTRFHSSTPVSTLQGVLSGAPAPRPRRLDFFFVSSPTGVGVKWGTNRQQRKWLTAAERLGTSTPCNDMTGGCSSFSLEYVDPHLLLFHHPTLIHANVGMLMTEYCKVPGGSCWTLFLLNGWKFHLWLISVEHRKRDNTKQS